MWGPYLSREYLWSVVVEYRARSPADLFSSRLKDGGKLNLSTQRVNVDGKRETSTENLPVLVFP